MNYIRHLTGFFDRVAREDRLNPTHISLYMSLFQFWNVNRFVNPISISRSEMMCVSKICSKATYHKVMKDLHELGFVKYEPSFNPFRGSLVTLINFDVSEVQKLDNKHAKKPTSSQPVVGRYHAKKPEGTNLLNEPYINNTNTLNSKQAYEQSNKNSSSDFVRATDNSEKNEPTTINQQRTTNGRARPAFSVPESVTEVKEFFEEEKSTKLEAEKFFNYFQSNGWRVGGRSPMKDWRAAARNWILNADKFKSSQNTSSLRVSTVKDYGEPL